MLPDGPQNKTGMIMKNVTKIEMYVSVNIEGNSHDVKQGTNLNAIMSDFRLYTTKNFLERWAEALDLSLDKDFKQEDFNEDGMFEDVFSMTLTYTLTFADDSEVLIDFWVDDDCGRPEYSANGGMADDFVKGSNSGEIVWDTDILDAFIRKGE
jgi:hypothetical protein